MPTNIHNNEDKEFIKVKDYIYRNNSLEETNIYDFVGSYFKKKIDKNKSNIVISSKFTNFHPQNESHYIQKRRKFIVPVLISPSFPRRTDELKIDLYCQLMLILFKPWRCFDDLKINEVTWLESFILFERSNLELRVRKFIQNIDYLKIAEKEAEEDITCRKISCKNNDNKELVEDFLAFTNDDEDEEDTIEFIQYMMNNDVSLWTDNGIQMIVKTNVDGDCVEYLQNDDIEIVTTRMDQFQVWQKETTRMISDDVIENENLNVHTLDELTCKENNSLNVNILNNIGITVDEVVVKFSLNYEQEKAFRIYVNESSQQKIVYCGGEGGTGKSQVINAISFYFEKNNMKKRLFIGAFTGTAAFNIRGSALHKLLSLTRQKKNNEKLPNSRIMQSKWKEVDHLIIDEVSLIGQWVLNKVHKSLMTAKNLNQNYGGVNILFCGDFGQLPPVNEEALYRLTRSEKGLAKSVCQKIVEKENGRMLWLQLTHVIILKEQMRQLDDPEFASLLSRLRIGKCTDADYELLNSRILSRNDLGNEWDEVPILVSRNVIKTEINKVKIKLFSQKYKKKIYTVTALDQQTRYKNIKTISEHTSTILKELDESLTANLITQLQLVIGAKYFITINTATEIGLANGSEVILKKIYRVAKNVCQKLLK